MLLRPRRLRSGGGDEFNGVAPSSCGLGGSEVEAYRANGAFVGDYGNRCFACTTRGVFCTSGPL